MQKRNYGGISGQQTVTKASTQSEDDATDAVVNSDLKSDDCELANKETLDNSSVYSDHLYCRPEQSAPSDQPVESPLNEGDVISRSVKPLLSEPSADYVETGSEPLDELSVSYTSAVSDSGSSSETNNSASDLLHCADAVMVQLIDTSTATLNGTCNDLLELDVADTEDVSLTSLDTLGISDSGIDSVSADTAGCTASSGSHQSTDSVSDSSEVVDLSDGRSVELECQCGAHYSNPSDKLHVVECQRCHSCQHAACVNYDLTDPLRGNYLCPHCHITEVSACRSCLCD